LLELRLANKIWLNKVRSYGECRLYNLVLVNPLHGQAATQAHFEEIARGVRRLGAVVVPHPHKVAQLMRSARLRGCPKRRYQTTTQRDRSHPVARNLLKRDFTADAPNRRWASDITYVPTRQGWLFLAVVMDLYSRRIVGWSMNRWAGRRLVVDALRMAVEARQPEGPLIHHSDSEYVQAGSA
jgi:transposase InsO family protein